MDEVPAVRVGPEDQPGPDVVEGHRDVRESGFELAERDAARKGVEAAEELRESLRHRDSIAS
jgi:hypothetical protein